MKFEFSQALYNPRLYLFLIVVTSGRNDLEIPPKGFRIRSWTKLVHFIRKFKIQNPIFVLNTEIEFRRKKVLTNIATKLKLKMFLLPSKS